MAAYMRKAGILPVCTNNEARAYFAGEGLTYADVTEGDILTLVMLLNKHIKKANADCETSIQRFYYEVIEKAADRSQPNSKHRLSQPIRAGQIIGSVEKASVGLLKWNAPQQPVPGSHKYPTDCTKSAPGDELF